MNDDTFSPESRETGTPLPATHPSRDFLTFLSERRSTLAKNMVEPGPSEAELKAMLHLAARVPDHGKLAPWRFILIQGEEREKLGNVLGKAFAAQERAAEEVHIQFERQRFLRAPVVVAVVSKPRHNFKIPVWEQELSAGAVCQTLLMAASASGYAAQWLTEWYAYNADVLAALGLRPFEQIAGYIYIGTAASEPAERDRPNLDDLCTVYKG